MDGEKERNKMPCPKHSNCYRVEDKRKNQPKRLRGNERGDWKKTKRGLSWKLKK